MCLTQHKCKLRHACWAWHCKAARKASFTVLSCPGGAWTIGYKAWGSLLGRRLSKAKVLVYCLDYRNFPQVCSCGACPSNHLGGS